MKLEFKNVRIQSCGAYLPNNRVTNEDLAKTVDTSDEWIKTRTGITQRFIADKNERTSDLVCKAVMDCMAKSEIKPTRVDAMIVATTTPDLTFPSTACIAQDKIKKTIGLEIGFAFDIQAVCSGFVYAFSVASAMLKSGVIKSALVVGADTLSTILDWNDRETCVLFGDGAGAMLLEAGDFESDTIYTSLHSDGSLVDILNTNSGVGANQTSGVIKMKGREVFKHATTKMAESILESVQKAGLALKDINFVIAHQANERILDAVAQRLDMPADRFIKTIQLHANTSAASIPLAFNEAYNNQKRIKRGDMLVFEALGGGLTWGACVLKF